MLRNLLNEIVRRRLWPIPAVALLVALAAPVLFLKSAPADAPAVATAAPAPAAAGQLPARAERLLASTAAAAKGHTKGSQRDPFEAPASHRVSADAAAGPAAAAPAAGSAAKPVAVVIQNADGTTPKTTSPSTPAPSASHPAVTVPAAPSTSPAPSDLVTSVDVRFGRSAGGRVHKAIPRLQPFFIHGKLAAVFVKYSPKRNRAVFAVAPGLLVTGPVKCRRLEGVCRYVDIPNGSFARLTMVTSGIVVQRRLDVEHIHNAATGAATTAVAAKDAGENSCLLGKLKSLRLGSAPIGRDICGG
ncbi:MAG: hypothetical protein QOE11_3052 [Solirubrobacteraceae bacterium]|nr:hypothetical protein [Solirubrobacteraceae bacterium]